MDSLNPLAIHFNHESIENVVIMIWPVWIKKKAMRGVKSFWKFWNCLVLFLSVAALRRVFEVLDLVWI